MPGGGGIGRPVGETMGPPPASAAAGRAVTAAVPGPFPSATGAGRGVEVDGAGEAPVAILLAAVGGAETDWA
jgi:hypothetical protein